MSKIKSISEMIKIETKCRDKLIRKKIKIMLKLTAIKMITNETTGDDKNSCKDLSKELFKDHRIDITGLQKQINEYSKEIIILKNLRVQIFEHIEEIDLDRLTRAI